MFGKIVDLYGAKGTQPDVKIDFRELDAFTFKFVYKSVSKM